MMADCTPSRRKIFLKVRETVVVPAPDDPVMAMMGWRSDMESGSWDGFASAAALKAGNPEPSSPFCFYVDMPAL
jgi:hypothetical protein